jgi:hypothetical protein
VEAPARLRKHVISLASLVQVGSFLGVSMKKVLEFIGLGLLWALYGIILFIASAATAVVLVIDGIYRGALAISRVVASHMKGSML